MTSHFSSSLVLPSLNSHSSVEVADLRKECLFPLENGEVRGPEIVAGGLLHIQRWINLHSLQTLCKLRQETLYAAYQDHSGVRSSGSLSQISIRTTSIERSLGSWDIFINMLTQTL